jgi:signal peptidase I
MQARCRGPRHGPAAPGHNMKLFRYLLAIVAAAAAAWAFHAFAFQAFVVPSGSMKPTLLIGDSVLVNKLAYGGLRYWCIPGWCPRTRHDADIPARGDVIVFWDGVHGQYVSKRVIALPGETVSVLAGQVFIDGRPLDQRRGGTFAEIYAPQGPEGVAPRCVNADPEPGGWCLKQLVIEAPPDATGYATLDLGATGADFFAPQTVPPGHCFVMGDNRDNSADSRLDPADGGVGLVALSSIVGRVERVLYSQSPVEGTLPLSLRPGRFLRPV